MHFDVPTLMAVGSFVSSVVGLLLLYAWFSDRSARSLLWWAAGDLVWAASAALILAFGARLGDPLIVLGPALVWTAARTFNRQKPSVPLILAGRQHNCSAAWYRRSPHCPSCRTSSCSAASRSTSLPPPANCCRAVRRNWRRAGRWSPSSRCTGRSSPSAPASRSVPAFPALRSARCRTGSGSSISSRSSSPWARRSSSWR